MEIALPISEGTWRRLARANEEAVAAGWAEPGVFATAVGPEYLSGAPGSLLYVGKSAGPLGSALGSCRDQGEGGRASTRWMVGRRNTSAFWQFVDRIDRTRRTVAWTNVCKMDRVGGLTPPSDGQWARVAKPCMEALEEEIAALRPRVTVFVTSGLYRSHVDDLLGRLGYREVPLGFRDGWTRCFEAAAGMFAILTKHPQGWAGAERDRVIALTKGLMRGEATGVATTRVTPKG